MLYAIIATDVPNSLSKRLTVRAAHIERLEILKQAGKLVLAGPHPSIDSNEPGEAGFSGSLVVAEFEDLTQAKTWADSDPYFTSGAYASVIVKPFKQVF